MSGTSKTYWQDSCPTNTVNCVCRKVTPINKRWRRERLYHLPALAILKQEFCGFSSLRKNVPFSLELYLYAMIHEQVSRYISENQVKHFSTFLLQSIRFLRVTWANTKHIRYLTTYYDACSWTGENKLEDNSSYLCLVWLHTSEQNSQI